MVLSTTDSFSRDATAARRVEIYILLQMKVQSRTRINKTSILRRADNYCVCVSVNRSLLLELGVNKDSLSAQEQVRNAAVIPLKIITPLLSIPALLERQIKCNRIAEQYQQQKNCLSKSNLHAVDENEAEVLKFGVFSSKTLKLVLLVQTGGFDYQ